MPLPDRIDLTREQCDEIAERIDLDELQARFCDGLPFLPEQVQSEATMAIRFMPFRAQMSSPAALAFRLRALRRQAIQWIGKPVQET